MKEKLYLKYYPINGGITSTMSLIVACLAIVIVLFLFFFSLLFFLTKHTNKLNQFVYVF